MCDATDSRNVEIIVAACCCMVRRPTVSNSLYAAFRLRRWKTNMFVDMQFLRTLRNSLFCLPLCLPLCISNLSSSLIQSFQLKKNAFLFHS